MTVFIRKLLTKKKVPYIMTSKLHKRCLDRVCEAALKNKRIKKNDGKDKRKTPSREKVKRLYAKGFKYVVGTR